MNDKRRADAPRFTGGQVVATPAVLDSVSNDEIQLGLDRHFHGDWGNVDDHDRQANEDALENGSRLLSVYESAEGTKFWIITEADRSSTTVLLPSDY